MCIRDSAGTHPNRHQHGDAGRAGDVSGRGGLRADGQPARPRQRLQAQDGDHARRAGDVRRAAGVGARQFVRDQLDRLGLGSDITHIPWGSKRFKLPPSRVGEAGG